MSVILVVEEDTAISTQIEKVINNVTECSKILKSSVEKTTLEITSYDTNLNIINLKYTDIEIPIDITYTRLVDVLL